jgi:hypothetical protein
MALAGYKPSETEKPITHDEPEVKDYQTAVVNNQRTPIESIVQYVEGSKWEVTYYSQLVDYDDPVTHHDFNLPDTLQQYTKINKLILHVDSPLDPQQYKPENYIQVTGSAIYYNSIPPNVGDMFVATLIGNRTGVFTLNNVTRRTYNNETVYSVEYNLVSIIEEDSEQYDDLESKVVKEYWYDKDSLLTNVTPLLTDQEYNRKLNLKYEYKRILDHYLNSFVHKDKKLLLLPGQNSLIYDNYIVKFFFKLINTTDSMLVRDVVRLNINNPYLDQPTIWSALLEKDPEILNYCNRKMAIVSTGALGNDPMFRSAVYSGVGSIIYPKESDRSADQPEDWPLATVEQSVVEASTNYIDLNDIITNIPGSNNQRLIPHVTEDEHYVFTEKFYQLESDLTVIESLTVSYLKQEEIDLYGLYELTRTYRKWGRLEQFYFAPILICLMRDRVQTTSSVV